MANRERGDKTIMLDRERTLRYDFNALIEIEEKVGISPDELMGRKLSMKEIRTLLWAGLVHEDTELTEVEVGAMIDMENLGQVLDDLMVAFGLSLEVVGGDDPKNAQRGPKRSRQSRKAGTGSASRK